MSVIGNTTTGTTYPRAEFKDFGDAVAGRIIEFEDYQVKDFQTKEPKFFEKSGDPIMGVKIVLETNPGDKTSRVALWAEKPRMLKAIKAAVVAVGASDLAEGADLAVRYTGKDGRAMVFDAAYALPGEGAEAGEAA